MSRIVNVFRTLRNNWKKTVFFSGLASYGAYLGYGKRIEFNLMNAYSQEAAQFGEQRLSPLLPNRHVTVILNPVANKKQAKNDYEKYCAPLFHLAGLKVSVVTTEAEGQAKDLMQIMDNTDCVVVAGGDGTVHEVVTGLLRRNDANSALKRFPVGIMPVGRTNTIAFKLNKTAFTPKDIKAKILGESSMAVIREILDDVHVMKIEGEMGRPVYSLGQFNMGQIRNTITKLDEYWYLGQRMKPYLTFFFQSFKDLSNFWDDSAPIEISFTNPCTGCSKCYQRYGDLPQSVDAQAKNQSNQFSQRWWHMFLPRSPPEHRLPDPKELELERMKNVVNDACDQWHTISVTAKNILIYNRGDASQMQMIVHPSDMKRSQFVSEGIRILKNGEFESPEMPPFVAVNAKEYRITLPQIETNTSENSDGNEQRSDIIEGQDKLIEISKIHQQGDADLIEELPDDVKVDVVPTEIQNESPKAIRELDEEPVNEGIKNTVIAESPTATTEESLPAKEEETDDGIRWLSIDNENYEYTSTLRISLLPRKLRVYQAKPIVGEFS